MTPHPSAGLSTASPLGLHVGALKILHQHGLARSGIVSELPTLSTPTYFPAVSSTCSLGFPDEILRLLIDSGYPRALVSAYDCKRRIVGGLAGAVGLLTALRKAGCTLILDSGLFECQVLGITDWTFEDYVETSTAVPHDILLSFDAPASSRPRAESRPRAHPEVAGKSPEGAITIIHGRDRAAIVDEARRAMVGSPKSGLAIPDRECGADLLERVRTVSAVRRAMNATDEQCILHILGCGSPVVMAVYTLAGADTFDSLDWTQGALDIRSLGLTDPLLLRFTGCRCKVCSELPGSDIHRALLHNLLFYQDFSAQLREMVRNRTTVDFLSAFVGTDQTVKMVEATLSTGPKA
jgi:queuine/archaeosine tRNA-ribosyltransferase